VLVTETPTLSRELTDLLVEFAVSLHKLAIYPDGHPLVESAVAGMQRRLDDLMATRKMLALGVARNQLIVDGVATDPNSAVLRELAQRLSRREVGALRFQHGVELAEVSAMVRAVARDAQRNEAGRGNVLAEMSEEWPNIRIFPLTYDQLELLGDDRPASDSAEKASWATQLWLGLARSALSEDPRSKGAVENADAATLARAIESRANDTKYGREIISHLARLAEGIRDNGGNEALSLRKRVAQLVGEIQPETMQRLLTLGADREQQRQLVLDASHVMAVDTVLDLARAASESSGQTMSGSLLHLLSKLARHAESGNGNTRALADAALRENVRQLVSGWKSDAGKLPGEAMLERIGSMGGAGETTEGGDFPCEPERVLQMSLEIGSVGTATRRALDVLVESGRVSLVVDLLDRTTELNEAVEMLREQFDTPETLGMILRSSPVDIDIVGRLVARLGPVSIEPLIESLDHIQDRKVRWRVLETVAAFGSDAGAAIVARLPRAPWYVQRNLLALIGKLPDWPANFSPVAFLRHADARVRREALKLLLANDRTRVAALCEGVTDADEHVVRLALTSATESCPPQAVGPIVRRVDDRQLDASLRLLGIRAVGTSRSPAVRDSMLRLCVTGKRGWLRRQKLAARSPLVMAALGVLASQWRSDPSVAAALRLARRSHDVEIRALAGTEVSA
jgi:hypothetical protein